MSWWSVLFPCCTSGEHPGGMQLLDRAVSLSGITEGSRVFDLAAGNGSTVRYLREAYNLDATGIDKNSDYSGSDVVLGDASALNLDCECADALLIECAFSQMENRKQVLSECARVLKKGGQLLLLDLYARRGDSMENSPLGCLLSREALMQDLKSSGFRIDCLEDCSNVLTDFWIQSMMDGRANQLLDKIKQSSLLRLSDCGYYLCVAGKDR